MKKSFSQIIVIFVIASLCVVGMIGCAGQQGVDPQAQQPGAQQPGGEQLRAPGTEGQFMGRDNRGDILDNNQNMNRTTPRLGQTGVVDNRQKTDNINNQLMRMNEIDDVSTVCSRDTAIIAYNPSNVAGDKDALDNMIVNRVRNMDPTLRNVVVTRSTDMKQRVEQLANDMVRNNRPANEIENEVRQLIQQINPYMQQANPNNVR